MRRWTGENAKKKKSDKKFLHHQARANSSSFYSLEIHNKRPRAFGVQKASLIGRVVMHDTLISDSHLCRRILLDSSIESFNCCGDEKQFDDTVACKQYRENLIWWKVKSTSSTKQGDYEMKNVFLFPLLPSVVSIAISKETFILFLWVVACGKFVDLARNFITVVLVKSNFCAQSGSAEDGSLTTDSLDVMRIFLKFDFSALERLFNSQFEIIMSTRKLGVDFLEGLDFNPRESTAMINQCHNEERSEKKIWEEIFLAHGDA